MTFIILPNILTLNGLDGVRDLNCKSAYVVSIPSSPNNPSGLVWHCMCGIVLCYTKYRELSRVSNRTEHNTIRPIIITKYKQSVVGARENSVQLMFFNFTCIYFTIILFLFLGPEFQLYFR